MKRAIKKVAVLGSGVMGSRIACHFAGIGVQVLLLDIAPQPPEGGFKNPQQKHEPTVWEKKKKMNDKVFINVKDNGPGIPQKILDKIFQPFFTTKPTGQGTGLGLSLSYDIVKAHGGELKVETKDGEGSVFIIVLNETSK